MALGIHNHSGPPSNQTVSVRVPTGPVLLYTSMRPVIRECLRFPFLLPKLETISQNAQEEKGVLECYAESPVGTLPWPHSGSHFPSAKAPSEKSCYSINLSFWCHYGFHQLYKVPYITGFNAAYSVSHNYRTMWKISLPALIIKNLNQKLFWKHQERK